jgi:hypothetical protein
VSRKQEKQQAARGKQHAGKRIYRDAFHLAQNAIL